MAPEILTGGGHDKAVDYWPLGALLYEMLTSIPPFYDKNRHKMFQNMLEKDFEIKPDFSEEAASFLKLLLTLNVYIY